MPPVKKLGTDESGKAALDAALDWTKVSTGVAAGTLVFGIGLLNGSQSYSQCTRIELLLAWSALGIAIVFGIFAQAAIPVMIGDKTYDLEHGPFVWPARIHQIAWFVGVLALAFALLGLLFGNPAIDSFKAANVEQAVHAARSALKQQSIQKLNIVELIKGSDAQDLSSARWHVQFSLKPIKNHPSTTDVFVDPVNDSTSIESK